MYMYESMGLNEINLEFDQNQMTPKPVWYHLLMHAQSCPTLCDPVDCSLIDSLSMEFSRKEQWSELGCHFLLQGIFQTLGLKLHLLHLLYWGADSLPLNCLLVLSASGVT